MFKYNKLHNNSAEMEILIFYKLFINFKSDLKDILNADFFFKIILVIIHEALLPFNRLRTIRSPVFHKKI